METTTTTTAVPPLELTRAPRKTPSLDLRDIPQAPGPEKGVLALMAMDPATYVGQCVTIGMTEDYFYLPAHKLLWRLFQARYNKNEPIDIVSITQALEDMHQLEAVGGSAGLAEIYTFTTTGAYFEHYLNVLKDKFILRSIIDIANQSTTQAFDNPDDVAELLDSVETHIFQIRERYNSAKDEQSLASILKQAVTNFEKFIASKGQIQGLTTGFEELDKKSNGLKPGDMFIIAARPSMGKTSFLLNIIEHIALNEKKPTLLFSCEMPAVQIVERLLFARSGVRSREIIKRGNLTQLEMKHFKQAVKEVGLPSLSLTIPQPSPSTNSGPKRAGSCGTRAVWQPSAWTISSSCAPTPNRRPTAVNEKWRKYPPASKPWPRNLKCLLSFWPSSTAVRKAAREPAWASPASPTFANPAPSNRTRT